QRTVVGGATLVGERPRQRDSGRVHDPAGLVGNIAGGAALGGRAGQIRNQSQVGVPAAGIGVTGCRARGIPGVRGDRRRRAADREVADDQQVTRPVELRVVVAGEAGGAANLVAAEGDGVLEEPESLLGVTAVVEAVRAEVDDVARRIAVARAGG